MAGNLAGLHVFAADTGPEPLALLDNNFSPIATAVNTLSTYSNNYNDSGAVNALSVAVPSPQVVGYSDGLLLQVKVAVTNTGAATINVNSLGVKPILNPDGSALLPGQLNATVYAILQYNASANSGAGAFVLLSPFYLSGSFVATLTGSFSSNPSGTINWKIVGGIAYLTAPNTISGALNSAYLITFTGFPAILTPSANRLVYGSCGTSGIIGDVICQFSYSGGVFQLGPLQITSGLLIPANFPSGQAGILAGWSVSYPL